jgi:hypothetical protein
LFYLPPLPRLVALRHLRFGWVLRFTALRHCGSLLRYRCVPLLHTILRTYLPRRRHLLPAAAPHRAAAYWRCSAILVRCGLVHLPYWARLTAVARRFAPLRTRTAYAHAAPHRTTFTFTLRRWFLYVATVVYRSQLLVIIPIIILRSRCCWLPGSIYAAPVVVDACRSSTTFTELLQRTWCQAGRFHAYIYRYTAY